MKLNSGQQQAMDIIHSGRNVFITGDAGVGKSALINELKHDKYTRNKNMILGGSTGIAAVNIEGATYHSIFNMPVQPLIEDEVNVSRALRDCDILVLDEIGPCRIDQFEYMAKAILKVNESRAGRGRDPIQVCIFGDFFQLAPVITDDDRRVLTAKYGEDLGRGYAFQSEYWYKLNMTHIRLNQHMRQQDTRFIEQLKNIKFGDDCGALSYFEDESVQHNISNGIVVCGTNKRVRECNETGLAKLPGAETEFKAIITGEVKDSEKATDDILRLKVGARIMTLVNNTAADYYNGSLGTITKIDKSGAKAKLTVNLDSGTSCEIENYTWEIIKYDVQTDESGNTELVQEVVGSFTQLPVKLAYAVTVHKSQGKTFDAVNFEPRCWEAGQLYVGLSRVRKIEDLHIVGRIDRRALIAAPEVKEFYHRVFGA